MATGTQMTPVELTAHVVTEIRGHVDAYRSLSAAVLDDVERANRDSVRLYLRCVADGRVPKPRELAGLAESNARRVRQGIPLEAMLRAYRIGTWTMWEQCCDGMDVDELRVTTDVTFRYIDVVSTMAERSYTAEREQLLSSQQSSVMLFVTRLIDDSFGSVADAEASAAHLGLDLDGSHVAVLGAPPDGIGTTERDRTVAELGSMIRRRLPSTLAAPTRVGLVGVVPSDNADGVAEIVRGLVEGNERLRGWVLGIGRPGVRLAGLRQSTEEARRAAALGPVFDPGSSVSSFAALSFYDLFRTGRSLDDFVASVMGPVVEHDASRGSSLVATLQAYYAGGGSRKAAAQALSIHPNTLDYRMRKVERLLGHSLHDGDQSFRLQLALRLLPLTERRLHTTRTNLLSEIAETHQVRHEA